MKAFAVNVFYGKKLASPSAVLSLCDHNQTNIFYWVLSYISEEKAGRVQYRFRNLVKLKTK